MEGKREISNVLPSNPFTIMAFICFFKIDDEGNEIGPVTSDYGQMLMVSEEYLAGEYKDWYLTQLKRKASRLVGVGKHVMKKVSLVELGYVS